MRGDRRAFIGSVAGFLAAATPRDGAEAAHMEAPEAIIAECPLRAVTRGPKFHYFGYYDKDCWDATGRSILGLEVGFYDRSQEPGDVATIGLIDTMDGDRFRPVAVARAWNWQQGCMLHWLGTDPARLFIHNDRRDGRFLCVVRDTEGREVRTLPLPVYNVSRDGRLGVTLNFARVHRTRRGYGYCCVPDPGEGIAAPEDDGIWVMDLESGDHRLVISLAQMAAYRADSRMEGAEHWFNHLLWNEDASRLIFLHRWARPGQGWSTRMYTSDPEGRDIRLLADEGMVSHFDWLGRDNVLAWSRHGDTDAYHLYDDGGGSVEVIGADVFSTDGHCSYDPTENWILTDTYPDSTHHRTLILYDARSGQRYDIGRFYAPPEYQDELRCDLHPRWSRDGQQVCIDSMHQDGRQMWVIDVSSVVDG